MTYPQRDDSRSGRVRNRGCVVLFLFVGSLFVMFVASRVLPIGSPSATTAVMPTVVDAARPGDGKLQSAPTSLADSTSVVPSNIDQRMVPERAFQGLARLYDNSPRVHDYVAAARELGRYEAEDVSATRERLEVGRRQAFYSAQGLRQAELVYSDDLAYYWVESGLTIDTASLAASAERLRNRYYPQLVNVFGREPRPGIDGDPRFHVLLILGPPDVYELGFFVEEDQYPRTLFDTSNEREIVYLNMSRLEAGTELFDGTLVHELQHLIQWNLDANEDKWLNEGLSQLAETVVGLDTVNPQAYRERTNLRLDRWSNELPEVHAHYAAAYLYLLYLWERVGDSALSELARHPANGLAAVRSVLAGYVPNESLESFTADWAVANLLDGISDDPRYSYRGVALDPPFYANRARQLPFEAVMELNQFGVDYIDLDFSGPALITFAGDTLTGLGLDAPPGSETFWYAPPANSSRMQLWTTIDLTESDSATLEFDAWHDLEPGYDFAYVSVSRDDGQTWELLVPRGSVAGAYGPAFGGSSYEQPDAASGWVHHSLSLDAYTGQPVSVRFDVTTDFEVSKGGFAVANLRVPQLEQQPAWDASGFVEIGAILPQLWQVRLVREGMPPQVLNVPLNDLNQAQFAVDLGPEGGVLVVLPLTPYTELPAHYWVRVQR